MSTATALVSFFKKMTNITFFKKRKSLQKFANFEISFNNPVFFFISSYN